jgi:hypothetical protein
MANIFSRIWGVIKRTVLPRPGRNISKRPASDLRRATPAELQAMGALPKSGRYVLKTQKKFGPDTPFVTMRQYRTKRTQELYGEALPPEKAARKRADGRLGYANEKTRKSAEKKRDTARLKRAYDGEKLANIRKFKELQERKKKGELLPEDDFDFLMDFAKRHVNQEHEFLHEDFINSPPKNRKKQFPQAKPRISTRTPVKERAGGRAPVRRTRGH